MSDKKEIRQNVKRAAKLKEADIITRSQFEWRMIIATALAKEITESLEKKIERKSRKSK